MCVYTYYIHSAMQIAIASMQFTSFIFFVFVNQNILVLVSFNGHSHSDCTCISIFLAKSSLDGLMIYPTPKRYLIRELSCDGFPRWPKNHDLPRSVHHPSFYQNVAYANVISGNLSLLLLDKIPPQAYLRV